MCTAKHFPFKPYYWQAFTANLDFPLRYNVPKFNIVIFRGENFLNFGGVRGCSVDLC